jgi:malonyl-CoA decarboxylase
VSFGHFLIKQVVEEIARERPRLSTFVTLSPVPGFTQWLNRDRAAETSSALSAEDRAALANLDRPDWWQVAEARGEIEEPLLRAAAWYFLRARSKYGTPIDPVARFHLGNGARLERLDWLADASENGLAQSFGLMVNYRYELDDIEKNHEAYAQQRTVIAANAVTRLVRGAARDVVPLAG